jgi:PTH1 family peptidyl-tRNA hydrolase
VFRRASAPQEPPEWLIVGLGNPGPEYKRTRHNLGFEVVELLAEKNRIKLDKSKHQARYGIGQVQGHSVLVAKPLTFMNLSGRSVAPLAKQFGLAPTRILVVADDTDLVPGRIRLKPGGSSGGHNGHKSIIESLGTQDYPRLKLGIGRVSRQGTIDHVLGGFDPEERSIIDPAIRRAAETIEILIERGLDPALNFANE